jgi:transcriptional regulator with XRE-family HTH domain
MNIKFDEKFYKRIGEFIFEERRKQDILQIELAEAGGLSRISMSNIELGKHVPDIFKLKKILNKLGYDLEVNFIKIS